MIAVTIITLWAALPWITLAYIFIINKLPMSSKRTSK